MRYVQLRAFHHVALSGGFSRAAEALHLSQPAISDQVRRLEVDYDVRLFDRRKKQIVLTPEGEELLVVTRRMFQAEREAGDLLSEARALRLGHLRIIADAAHHLLHLLSRFRQRYPSVRLTVRTGNSETVLEALRSDEADIGVLGELPDGHGFDVVDLGTSPIVAFVEANSALAGRSHLNLSELAGLPLVLREVGSKTRNKLETAAAAAGVILTPAIEVEGREAMREIVASGGGVGFVSAAEFGHDARLTAIPLRPVAGLEMQEALVCLRERSQGKLIRAFLDLAG